MKKIANLQPLFVDKQRFFLFIYLARLLGILWLKRSILKELSSLDIATGTDNSIIA